ncbi:MAG: hypothetical protein K0S79_1889 [Nitrospira sp.]|nr:hypothetical protein [Nitrospira sp.]
MGQQVVLHSTANAAERYLTAEVSGDYPGLLRLVTGKINLVEARGTNHRWYHCSALNFKGLPSQPDSRPAIYEFQETLLQTT